MIHLFIAAKVSLAQGQRSERRLRLRGILSSAVVVNQKCLWDLGALRTPKVSSARKLLLLFVQRR